MPDIAELIKQAENRLKGIAQKQFEEYEPKILAAIKAGEGVAELTETFEKLNGEYGKVCDDLKALKEQQAAEKQAAEQAAADAKEAKERLSEFERKYGSPDVGGRERGPSLGSQFVKAVGDEQAWKSVQANGRTEKRGLKAGDYLDRRGAFGAPVTKDISGADASAGALQDSLRIPGVITAPDTALAVQDLLPRTQTNNRTVDYVRELVLTNNAAPVAENETVAEATEKPKSDITFESVTESMHTIATWIAASVQILRYANRAQLQNYIDGRLRYMVGLTLEDQILTGDGTGNNLDGLLSQAAAYNRGYAQIASADPTKIDTLRRAITQARLAEYPVTGMVLHPTDLEDITLTKGSDLHYIWAMPGATNVVRPWGVAVAESTRMTEGEFLVGAFALGAELFIGEEIMVEATRYHDDFFTKNLVAILAELDALLAVYRPSAFVAGPFEEAATT